ncbi:hypothetical protein B7494_g4502 [Chlorociboria aeruginascens]|nr:hypothetical protein B7494_g4502 [Chlorociboria aeruginascens]
MENPRPAPGGPTLKVAGHNGLNGLDVIELVSDDGVDYKDILVAHSVNGNGFKTLDSSEEDPSGGNDDDEEEDDFSESQFEDNAIEELGDEYLFDGRPGACTYEEAHAYRQQLRTIGPQEFCAITVEAGKISAKKLLTAFGVRPPPNLDGSPDEAYYTLLGLAISRELSKRIKLPQYNTLDDAAELLKKSRNIIVLTGAGISTSLGIPDFRSKDTGLYAKLDHLGLSDPQEVFDIGVFRRDPSIFYSIAKDIIPSNDRFTPTHGFIALLQKLGKLLTNYSQNIDNIEALAGILPEKIVQCHGSFATASCVDCKWQCPGEMIFSEIKADRIPRCPKCLAHARPPVKRKRSHNGEKKRRRNSYDDDSSDDYDDPPTFGVMKPDITFFGEALPDHFSERLTNHDKHKVDLVIVIGTSLKVAPVSEVVPYLPPHIPQIYISRTPVSHVNFDIDMLGDCDVVVTELCRRAGWNLEHEMIPDNQEVDIHLQDGFKSRHIFTVRK